LWIKPQRGTKGVGIERIAVRPELDPHRECHDAFGLPLPFFAQKELPSSGKDLKVYVVGEEAWAMERRFPAVTDSEKAGSPADLPRKIREAALLCGRALGLELYGVDFLVAKGDRFAAIDVNAFPGYKGVAEVPAALAAYIHRRALAARSGNR
jgi:ribosomal protein S6--L-glutamate ligase